MKKKILIIVLCIISGLIGYYFSKENIKNKNEKLVICAQEADKQKEDYESFYVTMLGGSNMKDKGDTNSAGYIVRTSKGKLIIVDGGRDIDSELVMQYINKYGNGKVDYWFVTHPHTDHIGALLKLLKEENNLEIENICYSFLEDEWYKEYDKRGYEVEHKILEELKNNEKIKNKINCIKDQQILIDDINVDIIRVANSEITTSDNGNESSMVFKFVSTITNRSIIFLGDAYYYTHKELLNEGNRLQADMVQMAHHGQNGVGKEIYELIKPQICLFNCPEWLWDNNENNKGYNTGTWQTIYVRNWIEELGAKPYKAFEGDKTFKLTRNEIKIIDEN